MDFILALLGCLLVVEGLPYLAFPSKVKKWSEALQEAGDRSMRLMGLAAVGVGLLILFVIRFF